MTVMSDSTAEDAAGLFRGRHGPPITIPGHRATRLGKVLDHVKRTLERCAKTKETRLRRDVEATIAEVDAVRPYVERASTAPLPEALTLCMQAMHAGHLPGHSSEGDAAFNAGLAALADMGIQDPISSGLPR